MRGSTPTSTRFRWNDLTVVAESCVAGSSLNSRIRPATTEVFDDLHVTAEWLAAFHCQTTAEQVPAREWLTRCLVNGLCRDYAATFGLTAAETHLFAALSRHLETCTGSMLPLAWQHADFGPWNIYREGPRLRVIDWEVARRGPVLADLLYFATHWGAAVAGDATGARRVAHVTSLFCTPGATTALASAIRREIARYMDRVGVPQPLFACLLVHTFVEQALDQARRVRAVHRADAVDRTTNPYVTCLEALAHYADSLFHREARYAA